MIKIIILNNNFSLREKLNKMIEKNKKDHNH